MEGLDSPPVGAHATSDAWSGDAGMQQRLQKLSRAFESPEIEAMTTPLHEGASQRLHDAEVKT